MNKWHFIGTCSIKIFFIDEIHKIEKYAKYHSQAGFERASLVSKFYKVLFVLTEWKPVISLNFHGDFC